MRDRREIGGPAGARSAGNLHISMEMPSTLCPNCGRQVQDPYCPGCGQASAEHLISLRRMAADFVDDQFSLNATLPRTLGALFARPGFLTREYAAGRIVRYIRPFRMFLISTVLFFLALSFVANPDRLWNEFEGQMGDISEIERAAAEGQGDWVNVRFGVDTLTAPGWLRPAARRLQLQEARLNAMPAQEVWRVFLGGTIETAARISFLLVPVFALLLKLLYLRRKRLYVEHFVFALHFHAVAFLSLTLAVLIGRQLFWTLVLLYLVIYLFAALRHAYGQRWWRVGLKGLALLIVYPIILLFASTLAMVVAMLVA